MWQKASHLTFLRNFQRNYLTCHHTALLRCCNVSKKCQIRHQFADKGPFSQSYGSSNSCVQMWELDHSENWALKNWCLWIVVLEKTLRVPWTTRRSNLSILKDISSEYSLEGLMLKLKLQNFGQRADSLEKILMLGKNESKRERRQQRMRWLESITNPMEVYLSKLRETAEDRGAWRVAIHGVSRSVQHD